MGSGNTCVKVASDTFNVIYETAYYIIIMMVTEVVTCVSYLQLKLTNQHNTHTSKQ